MELKEIVEVAGLVAGYSVGIGLFGLAFNEGCKKAVNWVEKNKFYDKGVKFKDLENKTSLDFNPQELTKMQYKKYANSVSLS